MKVLIVGGGAVSDKYHIPAAIDLFGSDNVYLAEPSDERRKKLSVKFNLTNVVDNYKSKLKNVDFVVIATPPHLHGSIIIECMKENVSVLCEKPVTLSAEEGKSVIEFNENKNVNLGVCHTYRLFPNRIYVKELINAGYFGVDIVVDIQEGYPANWPTISGYSFRKECVPGGVLIDSGIHSLDFLLWCFGVPLEVEYYDDSLGGLESNAIIKLLFRNNLRATFRISRTCTLSNKITIKGSVGFVEFDIFDMQKLKKINTKSETILVNPDNRIYDWLSISKYQMEDFVTAIKNKNKPMCTVEEGVRVVELVERCYHIKKERPSLEKAPIPGVRF